MPRTALKTATPKPRTKSSRTEAQNDAAAKNKPLVEDIRLLGRILGDVIREQEGVEAFELIERVRQLSVAYRLKADASAGRVLDRLLKNLSADQTVTVIRAFSYFSHLANIAEDRHHVRRRAVHEEAGDLQEGSLALSFERLHRADHRAADIAHTLQQAYISPVLTAHPTEVQRKSILDAERAVSRGLGGSCSMPLAAHAVWQGDQLCLDAALGDAVKTTRPLLKVRVSAAVTDEAGARALGAQAVAQLQAAGAAGYLTAAG